MHVSGSNINLHVTGPIQEFGVSGGAVTSSGPGVTVVTGCVVVVVTVVVDVVVVVVVVVVAGVVVVTKVVVVLILLEVVVVVLAVVVVLVVVTVEVVLTLVVDIVDVVELAALAVVVDAVVDTIVEVVHVSIGQFIMRSLSPANIKFRPGDGPSVTDIRTYQDVMFLYLKETDLVFCTCVICNASVGLSENVPFFDAMKVALPSGWSKRRI